MTDRPVPPPGFRAGGRQIVPRPPGWADGPGPPWTPGAAASFDELLQSVPDRDGPLLPAFPGARHSAVLVLLHDGDSGPEVLLTRRSWELRNHKGEVSFPGGRMDPGETALETALREANEEVGLDPDRVEVHGELEHLNTVVSRSYIVPKVATIDHRPELVAQETEVERVMWVPLSELTRTDTYRTEVWGSYGVERVLHFFHLDDETIWGATGHMLVDLLRRTLVPTT